MKKGTITILVGHGITPDEIKEIRAQFSNDKLSLQYKLNIMISGNNNITDNLANFLKNSI